MSDYSQPGNRYTAIYVKNEDGSLTRAPYDVVRFNVDMCPTAPREIVPNTGHGDHGKVFEKVWIVESLPWAKKVGFNGVS